jgi:hypothetical protein
MHIGLMMKRAGTVRKRWIRAGVITWAMLGIRVTVRHGAQPVGVRMWVHRSPI